MARAPFGWTVVPYGSNRGRVYKRDCPADASHFAADLAPYTRPTRKEAEALAKILDACPVLTSRHLPRRIA